MAEGGGLPMILPMVRNLALPGRDREGPLPASLTVDEAGLEARAAELGKRSLKKDTKREAILRAISMIDLTTLEGADTEARVLSLCRKAEAPAENEAEIPPVAAVCVYPRLVATARKALDGSPVQIAAVASGFPAGQVPLSTKLDDTRAAVEDGATEIDIVIPRGAFLSGGYSEVFDEIAALKDCAGDARLKVILETGELGSFDAIARAAWIACEAGADFIKTSTGKVGINATPATALCMLNVVRDFAREKGKLVGVKVAGGIRTSKQALHYLVLVAETLGPSYLTNTRFRIGASSVLNDFVRQWKKQKSGHYMNHNDLTLG